MSLHRVKMLSSQPGSVNGLHTKFYMRDYVYDIPEALFNSFKELGAIELTPDQPEEKAKSGAPENRQEKKAGTENKEHTSL